MHELAVKGRILMDMRVIIPPQHGDQMLQDLHK